MNNIKVEELEKIKNELEVKYEKIEKKLLKMNSKLTLEEINNLEVKIDSLSNHNNSITTTETIKRKESKANEY